MRRIQPQPKQESRVESTQPSDAVSGDRLFPFTQKQDTGFGTVNQSVSSGIPSWSDEKEEGTMDPATWCSEVPHLQWWRSLRSCLHNYGSSNVWYFNIKNFLCLNWPVPNRLKVKCNKHPRAPAARSWLQIWTRFPGRTLWTWRQMFLQQQHSLQN